MTTAAGHGADTPDLLDRLARQPGHRDAVVHAGTTLTFDRLRDEAALIARWLGTRSVGRGGVVALHLPRGTELVPAILGTLTAGAAYLPVDPELPAGRRRTLLDEARADLVLVACLADDREGDHGPCARQSVEGHQAYAWCTAVPRPDPSGGRLPYRPAPADPADLAYVIHTSGSTGRPKGVEITRGAVSALLAELEAVGVADAGAGRVGWNASASFDASVQQWIRVCRGDTLVVLDEAVRTDPAAMAAEAARSRLTHLDMTPSHADVLLDHLEEHVPAGRLPEPLHLLIGGEPISPALWRRITALVERGAIRATNLYGPTECTVDATSCRIAPEAPAPHIGTVLPGLRLRLLDAALAPVEPGVPGEIHLSGDRLARGYRHAPARTAERFVPDPHGAPGSRMYRTGDLARLLEDGTLEYLGRTDSQLKLRGHRTEPGEVEAVLADHPEVAEAVAVLRGEAPNERLVAYCRVPSGDTDGLAERVERFARDLLPPAMLPSRLVMLREFPRTVNGKLDRAALPEPDGPSRADAADGLSPAEEMIAEVWSAVLGVDRVEPTADFFRLGGHSLLAIKLVARVKASSGVAIPLTAVYENPRLRDLAAVIDAELSRSAAR
ncbi:Dimodular nonribosomal peptide synthase [Nocardiopsis dassonvillei]|uniref:non-ribosomal peptide synthetase n=1 Tax=Nocardiopsis dassonvillei TaxID=2014 RepID=UPI003F57D00E